MPVKIRLMRIGSKKQPFYRVVAVDERQKRGGAYLELLGTYNPLTDPKKINLKQDAIDAWLKKGAVLSDGFLRMTGKAPQKPPRKPKKEKQGQSEQAAQNEPAPQPAAATEKPVTIEQPEQAPESPENIASVEPENGPETGGATPEIKQ